MSIPIFRYHKFSTDALKYRENLTSRLAGLEPALSAQFWFEFLIYGAFGTGFPTLLHLTELKSSRSQGLCPLRSVIKDTQQTRAIWLWFHLFFKDRVLFTVILTFFLHLRENEYYATQHSKTSDGLQNAQLLPNVVKERHT